SPCGRRSSNTDEFETWNSPQRHRERRACKFSSEFSVVQLAFLDWIESMTLQSKRYLIGFLGLLFLASLVLVQAMEIARKREEVGITSGHVAVPATSKSCVECHGKSSPGIIDHWKFSTHARKGVGCVECHLAQKGDVDGFTHYGHLIATVV